MYKKVIIIILGILSAMTSAHAQKVLFSCDFEKGIPSDFLLFDEDGNVPARGMKKHGLEQGIPWVGYTEDAGTSRANGTAYSGSWYQTAAQSNDWLITPSITITDAKVILSWRSHSTDKEHRDGYAVYISENGNTPAEFKEKPVFTVSQENTQWTEHRISLKEWAGKQIRIAFVNNSNNCKLLALDDICVYVNEHSFIYISQTPEVIPSPGKVQVKGALSASGFLPVNGYKISLNYAGESYVKDCSEEIVEVGDTTYFDFPVEIAVAKDQTVDYSVSITSGEEEASDIPLSITCFERSVLIEEGTGNWCMYCPRGQYGLQTLREKYGTQVIDIAVHSGDPMEVKEYINGVAPFYSAAGLPHCVMDRTFHGDPYYAVEELFQKAAAEAPVGKIKCEASLSPEKEISIKATAEFAKAIEADIYNLVFMVVEDGVTGYPQSNFYSGGKEVIGDLANLPDPIVDYVYANVARAIYPSFSGDTEAFTSAIEKRVPFEVNRKYPLPGSVKNVSNVKVVATIMEAKSGKIVNSAETHLENLSGIKATNTNQSKYHIYTKGNSLVINSPDNSKLPIYSVNGCIQRTLSLVEGINVINDLAQGIYLAGGKKVVIL